MPVVEVPFEVELNYAGWRLDRYLQQKITRLSRARIQKIIRERLRCDARPLKPSSTVTPGLRFVLIKDVDDEPEPEPRDAIEVLFDDPHLIAINKPAGLAVHPSARYYRHTVTQWMSDHARGADGVRPDLAHRLDRETSGVLICGRGVDATRQLKFAFARRQTEKTYLALTTGHLARDGWFAIDTPMRLTEHVKVVMEVHPAGMPSLTEVRVLRRGHFGDGTGCSLVECRPKTGRQHQIRVHLASIGHPIVGDKIYGCPLDQFLRFCKGEQTDADRAQLRFPRHALHAAALVFPHPATGVPLKIDAPLAADLRDFIDDHVLWRDEPADYGTGSESRK
jgi:23S rRNA pseudouridine1911/1915/1917 synthase